MHAKRQLNLSQLLLLACTCFGLSVSFNVASQETDEARARQEVVLEGQSLYELGDFDEIDRVAAKYLKEKSRTPSGIWKIGLFDRGVALGSKPTQPSEEAWLKTKSELEAWIIRSPKSPSAQIAYAEALIEHGWFIRGPSYARDVPTEAWPRFHAQLKKAKEVLLASKSFASHHPNWYGQMIAIAKAESMDEDTFSSFTAEAFKRLPGYYPNYFGAVSAYLPKWGGDMAKIEKFVRAAMQQTAAVEGNAMYARIYWYVSQECNCNLFTETNANWPQMKASFETVIKKYPDQWNLNHFAKFACEANDIAKAATLLKKLDKKINPRAWGEDGLLERCQKAVSATMMQQKPTLKNSNVL